MPFSDPSYPVPPVSSEIDDLLSKLPLDKVILWIGNRNPNAIMCVPPARDGQVAMCLLSEARLAEERKDEQRKGAVVGLVAGLLVGAVGMHFSMKK